MEQVEEIHRRDLQHPPFDGRRKNDIWQIKFHLDPVHDLSADQWEDQFRRDDDPDKEILMWIRVGLVFTEVVEMFGLKKEPQRELFKILSTCTAREREDSIRSLKGTAVLAKDQAMTAIRKYYGR